MGKVFNQASISKHLVSLVSFGFMENLSTKPSLTMNGLAYDLEAVEKHAWVLLINGSLRAKEPFHTGVLATQADLDMSLRTVVLRKVAIEKKIIYCHSDTRAGKIAEIQKNPVVSWLFYDPAKRIQLRLSGKASVHFDDEVADAHWKSSSVSSRKCYLTQIAPGDIQDFPGDGLPPHLQVRVLPTNEESEAGRKNFCVIATEVHFLDWLFLNGDGHRRSQFHYEDVTLQTMNWVNP
ncbi:MAG: pyridoxamine 5'-phosphate oxidase family protein [Verrucomicrobia bacterium]|nr:pyridoxamine 5'-phosphate oxidase family protein [Cytophagales bacterium]